MPWGDLSAFEIPFYRSEMNSSGARTATSLNTAYSHRVSGNAVAVRFRALTTDPLNDIMIFLDATTGTRGNVSIRATLYADTGTANIPDTVALATQTASLPVADDRWIRFTFSSPPALTVGRMYYVVFENLAAAPATNFPQILTVTNHNFNPTSRFSYAGLSTTNGFNTAGSFVAEMPFMVRIGSSWYGQPFTQQTSHNPANNTLWRGFRLSNDINRFLFEGMLISGVVNQWRIQRVNQTLTDTPMQSGTATANDRLYSRVQFPTPFSLNESTDYYLLWNTNTTSTSPSGCVIEDYASFPAVFDSLYDGITFCPFVYESAGVLIEDRSKAAANGNSLFASGGVSSGSGINTSSQSSAFTRFGYPGNYPNSLPTYVANSTGLFALDAAAKGVTFMVWPQLAARLSKLYIYVGSAVGAPPQLQAQVYGPTSVGTTLGSLIPNYSATANARTTQGWIVFNFTDPARAVLAKRNGYNVAISSSGADASNYCNIGVNVGSVMSLSSWQAGATCTTINSFGSLSLNSRNGVPYVAVFDNGQVVGFPYVSTSLGTGVSTNERGIWIPNALENFDLVGYTVSSIANQNGFKIYKNNVVDMTDTSGVEYFDSIYRVVAGNAYRLVFTYVAGNTRPGFMEIIDPDDYPDILAARVGGNWGYCELVSGTWQDFPKRTPAMGIITSGDLSLSSGSGGGLILPRGMNGGFGD